MTLRNRRHPTTAQKVLDFADTKLNCVILPDTVTSLHNYYVLQVHPRLFTPSFFGEKREAQVARAEEVDEESRSTNAFLT